MQQLIQDLETIFGQKPKVQGQTIKVTVPEVTGSQVIKLSSISFSGVKNFKMKRSGTGITVLFTLSQ